MLGLVVPPGPLAVQVIPSRPCVRASFPWPQNGKWGVTEL